MNGRPRHRGCFTGRWFRPGARAGAVLDTWLDGLLPRRCVLCNAPAGPDNLCRGCRADLPRAGAVCPVCALPNSVISGLTCPDCHARPPPWDAATAALEYRFPVDALVARFKFNRRFACGAALSAALLHALRHRRARVEHGWPDRIVPVPLHWARELRRSFNQADVLARPVGRALGLPVCPEVLRRCRRTRPQPGLGRSERRQNLRDAFEIPRAAAAPVAGAHIALVDDVLTTGATLGACCRALKRAGARRVEVWAAARAEPPAHRRRR